MKTWETFYPDVLPYIDTAVPVPMVDRHLMRAAQKFCDVTRAWKVELDPITLQIGQKTYDIDLDPDAELVRLESAKLDGETLSIWRDGPNTINQGRYVFTPEGRSIGISWTPSGPMSVVLTISARPTDEAQGVDDILAARYSQVISAGAVASLTGASPEKFIDECNAIAVRVWRGLSSARPRAKAMFL